MVKVKFFDHQGNEHLVDESEIEKTTRCYGVYIEDRKILLVKDPRSGSKEWELPGGGVETDESPDQGLVREFQEEAGLTPTDFAFISEIYEEYFSIGYQKPWKATRKFYLVKKVEGDLLKNGNGWDTDAVEFIDIKELENIKIQEAQRPIIQKAIEFNT